MKISGWASIIGHIVSVDKAPSSPSSYELLTNISNALGEIVEIESRYTCPRYYPEFLPQTRAHDISNISTPLHQVWE
jgi:hypothetical protein